MKKQRSVRWHPIAMANSMFYKVRVKFRDSDLIAPSEAVSHKSFEFIGKSSENICKTVPRTLMKTTHFIRPPFLN